MEGKASNQPAPPRSWRGGKGGRVGQVGRPLRGGGTATERPRHRPFPRLAAVRGAQASWAPFPARCGGSGLGRRGAKGVEESRLVSQRNKWGRAESLSRSHLQLAGRRGASKGVGRLSLAGQGGAARRGEAPALEARAGRGASLAGLLARCAQIGRCESPQHGPQQGGTGAGSGEVARPDI